MENISIPKARQTDVVIQQLNGEVLIYDLKNDKALCLNETSAQVWQMCNGKNSISEISRKLGEKIGKPVNEDLVWLAINGLKKENLIENDEELTSTLEGMNRREVIRKVGLASMVALSVDFRSNRPECLTRGIGCCLPGQSGRRSKCRRQFSSGAGRILSV